MLPLLLLILACQDPPTEPPAPDVVLVVADTLRADHLSLYGHERATSPNLDALGQQSMVFERALAHSGWTLPSMASMLTGRYPSEHQATRDPEDPFRFNRLDESLPTLASLFQAAGYRTGAWVNNVYMAPEFALDRGFDSYDYVGSNGHQERSAADTVAQAMAWLAADPQPAFLFLHFMEPHYPYLPPDHLRRRFTGPGQPPVDPLFFSPTELSTIARWTKRFSDDQQAWIRRLYDEEVLATDQALGQLVAGLNQHERWENCVLAVTADHGEEHWDHGAFEHGHALFGELIRVPLVLRAPSLPAQRVAAQVQHVDLFRTLLELAGLQVPAEAHGDDLRAWSSSAAKPPPATRPVLSEDCLYGPPRIALTGEHHRLVLDLKTRVGQVYQLDAYGQRDLGVAEGEQARELAAPLMAQMRQLRGDLTLRPLPNRTAPLDAENMEKLRALGYLE